MTPHNLPQNWQWVALGNLVDFRNGFAFKSELFSKQGDPIIRIQNIQNETISLENLVYLNPLDYKQDLTKYIIQQNDILIAMSGATTGKIGIYNLPQTAYLNQRVGIIRIDSEILRKYIFYFLTTQSKKNLERSLGTAQPNLSTEQIQTMQIPLPPLEIQREIVEILESKLEKIKEAKALLETSLQECETYRLSLLESAFSGNLTPHSQDWQWVKLGEICDTSSGGTPSRTQLSYWNGEIKWLKSGELNDGLIDNVGETITQEGLKHSSAKLLPKGTLLIAMYGATIGRLGILNIETSTNQAICAITPKEENMLDTKFLFYFLFASRPKMLQDSFGGAQKNISQAYLKQFSIPLPPLEIQREIVEILESKLEKIKEAKALLETSLQECETYRLSLLESAFAGELV